MMLAEQRKLMRDKFVQSRQYKLGEQQLMACNDALVGSAFQFDQVHLTSLAATEYATPNYETRRLLARLSAERRIVSPFHRCLTKGPWKTSD
jgi:hypothetical protein